MIETLKPYPAYKKAGLPWLDVVPAHWDMVPNRALMRDQRQTVGRNASHFTLLSLTLGGIIPRNMENPKGKFPAQFNTYKIVNPEDLVFCLFDIDETPRAVGLSKFKGMITGAYDVFSLKRGHPRFLYNYYVFVDEGKLLKPLYTGLRKTIQRGVFASLKTPCPPTAEQTAIVRFLDWANARLEQTIRAKRKIIALLNEQKQAIIYRAVTRGLDPNVPLKPSGVPWLCDIPAHWEMLPVRSLLAERKSKVGKDHAQYRLLSLTLQGVIERDLVNAKGKFPAQFDSYQKVCSRDFVFCLFDVDETPRTIGIAERDGMITGAYAVFLCKQPDSSAFVYQYFLAMDNGKRFKPLYRGLRKVIPMHSLLGMKVPLPPIQERNRIMDYVSIETKRIDESMRHFRLELELLIEYRTRLIADVVTGKLDVRDTAAKLPIEEVIAPIEDDPMAEEEALEDELTEPIA